jgi:hypothetical protein
MTFGSEAVYASLNDTETARAFAARLPQTIAVSGTGVDFCGPMPFDLPFEGAQVHRGWTNGDVNYNPQGGWFAILHGGQGDSARYGDQVVMGRIEGEDLRRVQSLSGAYDLLVELAE